jgi:signal transduction histidine kinase
MSSEAPDYRANPWELDPRGTRVLTVVRYALLVFCLGLTMLVEPEPRGVFLVNVALCALVALWSLVMTNLHPAWMERPRLVAVFVGGMLVLTAVLIVRDSLFGIYLVAFGGYAFALPWPRRMIAVAAVGALAGISQTAGVNRTTTAGLALTATVVAVNVYVMCALAWFMRFNSVRTEQREQALAEVAEANRKLEAAMEENAGLHQQLLTQAREAGILDERQRMAREIHDTLAQGLTGIVTQLQAAEQAEADPARWRRHFAAATGLARESLTEARRSVDALRPEPLEQARLGGAVASVAERWSALHGIAVQVTTTGAERPMSAAAESALLRAAQEALANVAKHAQATRVGLTLSYMDDEVALDVRDDGKGFEAVPAPHVRDGSGFGLTAMRQRIEALAGRLQIESEPGMGTAISACVPAHGPATAPAEVPA